jgi:NAD(P)-dependent dehydrogenase (short-subunit alcohol dehydrogenase family)
MIPDNSPRSALILGASGGIGSALARRLAASGWSLTLAARDAARLAPLAEELSAHAHAADATDPAALDACVAAAEARHGRLDGVVNCCGSLLLKPAHATTDAEWAATIAVNLTTAFHVVRAATARMMRSGGGSVVLMSSAVASRGMINHEAIAAAKAGVEGLALSAAASYARHGIRVNCVAPGLTRTPLTARLTAVESSLRLSSALHPLDRIGEAAEVAAAVAWFLDPAQSWVTGQVLGVDGGLGSVQARPSA